MRYIPLVCLIALSLNAVAQAPPMTKGVSVQMAATYNAVPFPAADNPEAWVVAVTADGRLFFGVKPVDEASLVQEMKSTPRHREAKVYIKADARAPFQAVKEAFDAAHDDLFETAVLLTEQLQAAPEGQVVPPQGLEIRLGLPSSAATVVQMHNSGRPILAVKVNDREIPWPALQNALEEALQNQSEKLVVIEADGSLPFAEIAKVIDVSRSFGATVAISLASL